MAHMWGETRAPNYEKFTERETPEWFRDARLGIFIHWGPYSVPAWAETTGELGHIPEETVHKHNPYAEWYFNTIRIEDSPAAKRHKEIYGDAPYDDFLDDWKASKFDAVKLVRLFKDAGAEYVMPVTKHHDGITLWDAPESKGRNTVHRGPKRDIVAEWAKACEQEDVKFGVYYSTGIDWHYWPTEEPWQFGNYDRPGVHEDAHAYNQYAWQHCADLIDKYRPYLLWGDCDWPMSGIAPGDHSVEALLNKLYRANPEAVINDRFGNTHWDFHTVEYGLSAPPKDRDEKWTFTRGIGLSFGYNSAEDESHSLNGRQAATLLVDVSSRGADLLLNVGPDAEGNIPPVQERCLQDLGQWVKAYGEGIFGTSKVDADTANPSGETSGAWVRWTRNGNRLFAFVDSIDEQKEIQLLFAPEKVDIASAKILGGGEISIDAKGTLQPQQLGDHLRPVCVEFVAT